MLKTGVLILAAAAIAVPAWPCSVAGYLSTPQELVARAPVIVRARADGLAEEPGREGTLAGSRTQVRFKVLAVYKGTAPSNVIQFNGYADSNDDPNDRPAPYDSTSFHTREGVHPASPVVDVKRVYGDVTEIVESEIESRQFITFAKQPAWLTFRLNYTGNFPTGSRKTREFNPGAKIYSIAISLR